MVLVLKYCWECGKPLSRLWNRQYKGKLSDFCNEVCYKLYRVRFKGREDVK